MPIISWNEGERVPFVACQPFLISAKTYILQLAASTCATHSSFQIAIALLVIIYNHSIDFDLH